MEAASHDVVFSPWHADVFDALHRDKDYAAEVEFVLKRIAANLSCRPALVVDMACGTGRHALEFARHGIEVFANDLSPGMIAAARRRGEEAQIAVAGWHTGPMQKIALPHAAAARYPKLFCAFYTALGYLVDPAELDSCLANLSAVTKPGDMFFADNWNMARMAHDFSPSRTKAGHGAHESGAEFAVTRTSAVAHLPAKNALTVAFTFRVQDRASAASEQIFSEKHVVRYFAPTELDTLLERHGFRTVEVGPFFEDTKDLESAWNFYTIAVRK